MLIMMIMAGIAFFVFPILIKYFLPKFIFGIQSMKILVFCTIFSALVYLPQQYCIVMNKRWYLVFAYAAFSLLYYLALNFLVNKNIFGFTSIDIVALARVALNFLFFLFLTFVAFRYLKNLGKFIRYVSRVALFITYYVVFMLFIDAKCINPAFSLLSELKILAFKLILFFIFMSPLIMVANKEAGLLKAVKDAYFKKEEAAKIDEYIPPDAL